MYAVASALAFFAAVALASQPPDAAETIRRSHPIHDPAVDRYLARLGRQLAAQWLGAKPVLTFTLIAHDPHPATHEPTALAGGFILVPVALFAAVDDEAEFAAMIAHAMGHVVEHHGMETAGPNELRADALAISLAASAGFDPGALARYIARVPTPWSTERLAAMQPIIARFPIAGSQVSSSEFLAIQREVSALSRPTPKPSARPGK